MTLSPTLYFPHNETLTAICILSGGLTGLSAPNPPTPLQTPFLTTLHKKNVPRGTFFCTDTRSVMAKCQRLTAKCRFCSTWNIFSYGVLQMPVPALGKGQRLTAKCRFFAGEKGLFAADGQPINPNRGTRHGAAEFKVVADRVDIKEHLFQVPRDGDFFHRKSQFAAGDP
jgi:hypothetical protein